jgi:hypothetical protein
MPDAKPTPVEEAERKKRMVDDSADHWKVGPRTKQEAEKIKSREGLDAEIPLAPEDEEGETGGSELYSERV